MEYLYGIDTGKSRRGIRQEGGKERWREKDLEREREREREGEQHSDARKRCGLILTVGLNQQHLQILNT